MAERLPQIQYQELTPEVQTLADDILKVSSAALGGPYNALLRSPEMGEQAVIDLTVVSGTYVMVSMLLNATQVEIPNGGAEPLEVMSPLDIRKRLLV